VVDVISSTPSSGDSCSPTLALALVQKLGRGQTGEHLVPIDRSRFREVYKVEEAVGVVIRSGIIWACEGEPMTADFVGILAGLLGHGIDQFDIAHDRKSPGKRERTGTQKRPAARGADGADEKQERTGKRANQPANKYLHFAKMGIKAMQLSVTASARLLNAASE
jgi:hypothetical protein